MKRKKMIIALLFIVGLLTVSCFKNNKEDKKVEDTQTTTQSSDIFNLGNGQTQNQNNIDNLTPDEQNFLINNNIDPVKVSEAIKSAESGDKDSILSLAQLYISLKDNEKAKKYLQMGVNKNFPEAIYNLAVIYKNEGNMEEANKLISKLPKDMMSNATGQLPAGAAEYNKGIEYVKAKNYKLAKQEFEKAYNKGIKDADMKIAVLNKELKNSSEALKWFKIAANRGVKEANLEAGAILFDSGKTSEARSYLQKAYNNGNKGLAMPIAITYHKENNMTEALKWYKIAAKNGDKDAQKSVVEIENASKDNTKTGNLFLGETGGSFTEKTINETTESKNQDENKSSTQPVKTETVKKLGIGGSIKESSAKPKENYNVEIDEIINDQVMKYSE